MTSYNKVGFHTGLGQQPGIGAYMDALDAAGIPFMVKSVGEAGIAMEAAARAKKSGVAHQIMFRWAAYEGMNDDHPDLSLPPEVAADRLWAKFLEKWAQTPELHPYGDYIWYEVTNEVDTNANADFLSDFTLAMGENVLADGRFKVALSGHNGGQPERHHWLLPGFSGYLQLCAQHPDKLGVSLHEGKIGKTNDGQDAGMLTPLADLYDHMVGRFTWLFDVCDFELKIARPPTFISEWWWAYNDMPGVELAMADVKRLSELVAKYEALKGVYLWNLAGGWSGLGKKLARLLTPITQYTLDRKLPDPLPPPSPEPPDVGDTVVYLLIPQNMTLEERMTVCSWGYQGIELPDGTQTSGLHTLAYSHTDAMRNVRWGNNKSRLIVVEGGRIGTGLDAAWILNNAPDLAPKTVFINFEVPDPPAGLTDGFDPPVGTAAERAADKVWPGNWEDVNPYLNLYTNSSTGRQAYHTGSDLNLNYPVWDKDAGANLYAAAHGKVLFADEYPVWGKIMVVEHQVAEGQFVYSRYGHMLDFTVPVGKEVKRGDLIGHIGQDALKGPYHLHFDISHTDVLRVSPTHWPGMDKAEVQANYVDPRLYIKANRPERDPGSPIYHGPPVVYASAIHGPGSDWMWGNPSLQALIQDLQLPVKFATNGSNFGAWQQYRKPEFELIRLFWQPNSYRSPEQVWLDLRGDVRRFYDAGARKFELFNEPNLPSEGLGTVWDNGDAFGRWLEQFIDLMKAECPEAKLYYPGLSPGVPWTNQFDFTNHAWPWVRDKVYGFCLHAYTGVVTDVTAAVNVLYEQIKQAQAYIALDRPLIISECSVNRGNPDLTDAELYRYKAAVYFELEMKLANLPGIEGCVWFISNWDPPPAQETDKEIWLGTSLPREYTILRGTNG